MYRVITFVLFLCGLTFWTFVPSSANDEKPKKDRGSKAATLSFKSDVFPIIRKHCLPCHAEENFNPSDLHLDNYDFLMEGGKHGPPVKPGNPKESLLIMKLNDDPPFGEKMPLKSKTGLTEEEKKILWDWIEQGAKKN